MVPLRQPMWERSGKPTGKGKGVITEKGKEREKGSSLRKGKGVITE